MKYLHHKRLALASVAVAIAAVFGGIAAPYIASAEPATPATPSDTATGVTVPLNTPFTSGDTTYTIVSASTKPDVDGMLRLDLVIRAEEGDSYGLNFWDSTFRLNAGADKYAPVSNLNEIVDANSTMTGTITFVVPDTTTAATFVILFPEAPKEVPLTISPAPTASTTGSNGGQGVSVPLNTPFSSGEVTYTIVSATAEPDVDGMTRLDLVIKAELGAGYGLNFWDATFRLQAGSNTYEPVSDLNEIVAAHSTMNGTVSFVVPDTTTTATFIISFEGGDRSVPVTFGTASAR